MPLRSNGLQDGASNTIKSPELPPAPQADQKLQLLSSLLTSGLIQLGLNFDASTLNTAGPKRGNPCRSPDNCPGQPGHRKVFGSYTSTGWTWTPLTGRHQQFQETMPVLRIGQNVAGAITNPAWLTEETKDLTHLVPKPAHDGLMHANARPMDLSSESDSTNAVLDLSATKAPPKHLQSSWRGQPS